MTTCSYCIMVINQALNRKKLRLFEYYKSTECAYWTRFVVVAFVRFCFVFEFLWRDVKRWEKKQQKTRTNESIKQRNNRRVYLSPSEVNQKGDSISLVGFGNTTPPPRFQPVSKKKWNETSTGYKFQIPKKIVFISACVDKNKKIRKIKIGKIRFQKSGRSCMRKSEISVGKAKN